jgi:hypothetical protein
MILFGRGERVARDRGDGRVRARRGRAVVSRGKDGLRLKSLKYMLELTVALQPALRHVPDGRPHAAVRGRAVRHGRGRRASDAGAQLPMKYLHEMGEPSSTSGSAEAIDLFPGVCVSTNGTLLNERWAKDILDSSLSKLRICIDTLKPEVYPIVRKGGKFDVVVENTAVPRDVEGKEDRRRDPADDHDADARRVGPVVPRLLPPRPYPQATSSRRRARGSTPRRSRSSTRRTTAASRERRTSGSSSSATATSRTAATTTTARRSSATCGRTPIAEIAHSPFLATIEEGFRNGRLLAAPALRGVLQEPGREAAADGPPVALRAGVPVEGPVPEVPERARREN